ncbi:MAG: phospho-N-acetylmuramoyl-pentapeptide-transferase [Clostridiales bacterium]|nr:phospho-N-acetylmuramoyl-pentapeptide-transferase [Clostridiales bacterium]
MIKIILQSLIALIISFLVSALLTPFVIKVVGKLKARQTILHYVDNHLNKQGTPTMGGIGFILAVIIAMLFFDFLGSSLMSVAVMAAYGVVGGLDDFIKIKYKQNKGLKAYQKIIAQTFIAIIIAIYTFRNKNIGSYILIPFTSIEINLGIFIIPFIIFMFLAVTNSVNLTDGLDGLAGGVTLVFMLFFGLIQLIYVNYLYNEGYNDQIINEYIGQIIFGGAVMGGVLGYLIFNSYPAKIFMGDTGSLALGGAVACVTVFTRLELLMPIIGVMFVLSSLSVIIQVLYFKATGGKRVFLMAPLHHHFERKGIHESKITVIYIMATAVMGILSVILYLLFL